MFQMVVQHILIAVVLAAILYCGYLYFQSQRKYVIEESFEVPAPAPLQTIPIPDPPRTVAAAGPNSPSQAPPEDDMPVRLPGPSESDPFEESFGSSDVQDNMRYPERLFGPAPKPNKTEIAVSAGVASPKQQVVSQALQTFSPDFAQNGDEFIDRGIFANDTYEIPNYSAI
jgi:hypothetical protein